MVHTLYSDSAVAFIYPKRVDRRAHVCMCNYVNRYQHLSYISIQLFMCHKFCFISLNRSCGVEVCAHCTANTGIDQEHALWRRRNCFHKVFSAWC